MAIKLTAAAVAKIKAIRPENQALRFGVQGGGCSGFSYSMQWEIEKGPMDKEYDFEGLKVFVDPVSIMYLDGCEVDYLETLEASGFKFNNPNVKSTCGCGSSFSA
jgi:iron-sulfur cluster assembly accessory protein